jgi:O-antigen ligase
MLSAAAFLTGFFPPLSIAGANVALFLFLAAALASHALGRERIVPARTVFDVPILFFLAAWALSSALGMDPAKSFGKFGGQARFLPFYLALWVGGGRYRPMILRGYLWGAGTAVAYGGLQYVMDLAGLPARFPGFYQSWGGAGYNYLALVGGRIHGAVHPLTYAETILPFFLMGTAAFLEAEERNARLKTAAWFSAGGAALLLSQSRGPWLAAGVGLAVLCFHPRRRRLLLPLALAGASILFLPSLRDRGTAIVGAANDESTSHRLVLWNNAWQVAKRRPWFGAGPGCLKAAVERTRGEPGFLPNPRGRDGDAHNQYLHHLAERGVPGLAALLILLGLPLIRAFRGRASREGSFPGWVRWGLLASFAAYPIANLTERAFDDAEPALVFWVMASLLPVLTKTAGGDGPARSEDARRS